SQLGFMFLACGVGAYAAAIFHLVTHAFFKALLFLAACSVIHALSGEQDISKMGGLWNKVPATHWVFLIGTATIAGFPFLSGWWSKDEILGHALTHRRYVLWALGAAAAFCTAIGLAGWFIAHYFYYVKPEQPNLLMNRMKGVYTLLWNKYWVDELYDRIAVEPSKAVGRSFDKVDTVGIDRVVVAVEQVTNLS